MNRSPEVTMQTISNLPMRSTSASLVLLRIIWGILTALMMGLFLFSIPAEYQEHLFEGNIHYALYLVLISVNVHLYAAFRTIMDVSLALAFGVIGIILFIRKSDDWMVMLVSIASQSFAALFVPTLTFFVNLHPGASIPVSFIRALGLATSLIVFFYLVPDGRFTPRWTRWASILWGMIVFVWFIFPGAPANLVHMSTWSDNMQISFVVFLVAFGSGVYAQIIRYRNASTPLQRQQMKWISFGTIAGFSGFALYHLPIVFLPSLFGVPGVPRLLHIFLGIPIYHTFVFMAPLCIAICTSRFRLWDIDHLITRTLIYGTLTVILGLVYAAFVILLGQLLRIISGYEQSNLVTALSTLAIAVLFVPLRRSIQAWFEKRFYRNRYTPDRMLIALSDALRDEVDLDILTYRLLLIVQEILQPVHVSLSLVEQDIKKISNLEKAGFNSDKASYIESSYD